MEDYTLLKSSKEELFEKAGYSENYAVYRAFIDSQQQDDVKPNMGLERIEP